MPYLLPARREQIGEAPVKTREFSRSIRQALLLRMSATQESSPVLHQDMRMPTAFGTKDHGSPLLSRDAEPAEVTRLQSVVEHLNLRWVSEITRAMPRSRAYHYLPVATTTSA
eukprot:4550440-Amphidinium_carterae.1